MTEEQEKYNLKKALATQDKLTSLLAEFDELMAEFSACAERGQKLLVELSQEIKMRKKQKTDRACLTCEVGRMEEKSGPDGHGWYCSLCDVFEPWE